MRWIVGVDEAGRGALAGPVAVGAILVPHDFDWNLIPGVGDSKAIAPKRRHEIYIRARELEKEGMLTYAVALIPHKVIDTRGITFSVRKGIEQCLVELEPKPKQTLVKLDGLLKAPEHFTSQQTIIRGDATEKEIGLASIMAKVTRDLFMVRAAKRYPGYGFEIHKGYGTVLHRKNMAQLGLSFIHRTTFCKY